MRYVVLYTVVHQGTLRCGGRVFVSGAALVAVRQGIRPYIHRVSVSCVHHAVFVRCVLRRFCCVVFRCFCLAHQQHEAFFGDHLMGTYGTLHFGSGDRRFRRSCLAGSRWFVFGLEM